MKTCALYSHELKYAAHIRVEN